MCKIVGEDWNIYVGKKVIDFCWGGMRLRVIVIDFMCQV